MTDFRELELRLMDPAVRGNRAAVGVLLAGDFVEFASDGRVYGRDEILDLLAAEAMSGAPDRGIDDFAVRMLSADIALVTYRASARGKRSLRSSIWCKVAGDWRMVFHQGTPA
ncbi:MAG TPA: DUF4440 domain-containing protein [Rhizomicrobium sp.]|nr:DUF4440 domain-containing protein [Rhizomicrobium sp.]